MATHDFSVYNMAVSGTTSNGWARENRRNKLKEAVDNNPDAEYVWLTTGGNDAMPKLLSNTPID